MLRYLSTICGWRSFGTLRDSHPPDIYETNGETGQPLWVEIFRHILKECAYLTAFHTVYVMVDTRNLKAHETAQDGLPHWPAAVAWWYSRVQLVGPQQEKTELLFFPATEETGLHRVHPTWAGMLWWLFSLVSTSSCWIVTACQLPSSKQPTFGRKVISQDFPRELEKVYLRSTRCTESVIM